MPLHFRPTEAHQSSSSASQRRTLFQCLVGAGIGATGRFSIAMSDGRTELNFNARNTQFGALYQTHFLPLYEPEVSVLLDLLIPDDGCFMDVGANWGWFSLYLASRPGFRGRIHCFEPVPATFADLSGVVDQAGLADRITCHQLALSDHDGSGAMTIPGGLQSGLARISQSGNLNIQLATLDSLTLSRPDMMKLDVEDHEIAVLRGAAATIEQSWPYVVFENWRIPGRPAVTLDPLRWLAERGYSFFHTGWVASSSDEIVPELPKSTNGRTTLALLPFATEQRFYLPAQLNVLAVPERRLRELHHRMKNVGTPTTPFLEALPGPA